MKRIFSVLAMIMALAMLSGTFALPANAATDTAAFAAEVVRLVNIERASDGRYALSGTNAKLNQAAQIRAAELATRFAHERPDNRSWATVLRDEDIVYTAAGENIARGHTLPAAVMGAWMNSTDHRRNILGLQVNYTSIGVGVYEMADGTICWVQLFINDGTAPTNPDAGKLPGGGGSTNIFTRISNWFMDMWTAISLFFSRLFSF